MGGGGGNTNSITYFVSCNKLLLHVPVKWPTEISLEHEYNECESDKLYKSVTENGRPKVKRKKLLRNTYIVYTYSTYLYPKIL